MFGLVLTDAMVTYGIFVHNLHKTGFISFFYFPLSFCHKQHGVLWRQNRFSFSLFEAPRSKLRGIFDRKEVCYFQIRSLTPQQAAGNALAFAVQVVPWVVWRKTIWLTIDSMGTTVVTVAPKQYKSFNWRYSVYMIFLLHPNWVENCQHICIKP